MGTASGKSARRRLERETAIRFCFRVADGGVPRQAKDRRFYCAECGEQDAFARLRDNANKLRGKRSATRNKNARLSATADQNCSVCAASR